MNYTTFIDLSQSWTNSTVELKEISYSTSGINPRNNVKLWPNTDRKMLYRWGGDGTRGKRAEPDDTQLWVLAIDDNDGGSGGWTIQEPANANVFADVVSGTSGASTTCGDKAFYIGGFGTVSSDPRFSKTDFATESVPIPGVLSFDESETLWANDSSIGLNKFGRGKDSNAVCLDNDANNSLIVMFGGLSPTTVSAENSASDVLPMSNITIYDTEEKRWHYQAASGSVPIAAQLFCSVAAKSPDGTYEMCVFMIFASITPGRTWKISNGIRLMNIDSCMVGKQMTAMLSEAPTF